MRNGAKEVLVPSSRIFFSYVVLRRPQCLDSVHNHAEVKSLLAEISDDDGRVISTGDAQLQRYLQHLVKITETRFAGEKNEEGRTNAIEINPKTYKGLTAVNMSLDGAMWGLDEARCLYFRELAHRLSDTVAFKRKMVGEVVNFMMLYVPAAVSLPSLHFPPVHVAENILGCSVISTSKRYFDADLRPKLPAVTTTMHRNLRIRGSPTASKG